MGVCNVFNIERYATEDGRGIRTVVIFKGLFPPLQMVCKPRIPESWDRGSGEDKCLYQLRKMQCFVSGKKP